MTNTIKRTHFMPVKNSLLCITRLDLLLMVRDCRDNAAYNRANGFEACAQTNDIDADYYLYLADRSI